MLRRAERHRRRVTVHASLPPPGWTPPDPAHLQVWMNAQVAASIHNAIAGANVSSWTDQSANAFAAPKIGGTNLTYSPAGGPSGKAYVEVGIGAAPGFAIPNNAVLNAAHFTVFFAGMRTAMNYRYTAAIAKTNEGNGNLGWALGPRVVIGDIGLWVNNDSSGGFSATISPAVGAWFSCAARYDGANLSFWSGTTKMADVAYATPLVNSTGVLAIGDTSMAGSYAPFEAKYLETAFYNTALSDVDVLSWMTRFHTDYGL